MTWIGFLPLLSAILVLFYRENPAGKGPRENDVRSRLRNLATEDRRQGRSLAGDGKPLPAARRPVESRGSPQTKEAR